MNAPHIIFYIFAALQIFAAIMVIVSRNPVHGVLFLVLTFFASSVLWMLMQAEFLSLVLIFVYVGAVMTLFLFVVMMLNIDLAPLREGFVRYMPFGILFSLLLLALIIWTIIPSHFALSSAALPLQPADYSNTQQLGAVLYTQYMFPFELAAVILLTAIIAAISLAFRGRRDSKLQNIAKQVAVNPKDRMSLINIKPERK